MGWLTNDQEKYTIFHPLKSTATFEQQTSSVSLTNSIVIGTKDKRCVTTTSLANICLNSKAVRTMLKCLINFLQVFQFMLHAEKISASNPIHLHLSIRVKGYLCNSAIFPQQYEQEKLGCCSNLLYS